MARTAKSIIDTNSAAKQEPGTPVESTKRRPGRPRKSSTNSTSTTGAGKGTGTSTRTKEAGTFNTGLDSANFQVETPYIHIEETAPQEPGFIDNVANLEPARKRRVSKTDKAYSSASELVTVANILAMGLAGPDAGMNMIEENLITASLTRVLEKGGAVEKIEEKMTPVTLVIGMSIWAIRVGKMTYDRNKDKFEKMRAPKKQEPVQRAKPAAPEKMEPEQSTNGYVGEGTLLKNMLEFDANI